MSLAMLQNEDYSCDVHWSREKEIELIEQYRCRPHLWNKTNMNYYNKVMRVKSLAAIAKQLEPPFNVHAVKQKLKNLRTYFMKQDKRVIEGQRSGWEHYRRLQFLKDTFTQDGLVPKQEAEGMDDNDTLDSIQECTDAEVTIVEEGMKLQDERSEEISNAATSCLVAVSEEINRRIVQEMEEQCRNPTDIQDMILPDHHPQDSQLQSSTRASPDMQDQRIAHAAQDQYVRNVPEQRNLLDTQLQCAKNSQDQFTRNVHDQRPRDSEFARSIQEQRARDTQDSEFQFTRNACMNNTQHEYARTSQDVYQYAQDFSRNSRSNNAYSQFASNVALNRREQLVEDDCSSFANYLAIQLKKLSECDREDAKISILNLMHKFQMRSRNRVERTPLMGSGRGRIQRR